MRIYIYTSHHAWLVDIYEYMIMLSDHYLTTQKFKQKIKVWRQRWHLLWTTLYASTFAMDWWLCVSRWKVWANPQDLYVWYIYLHENPSKSTIHVGKYTSPMDPMEKCWRLLGVVGYLRFSPSLKAPKHLKKWRAPKRKDSSRLPSIFRGYVSFREGNLGDEIN